MKKQFNVNSRVQITKYKNHRFKNRPTPEKNNFEIGLQFYIQIFSKSILNMILNQSSKRDTFTDKINIYFV